MRVVGRTVDYAACPPRVAFFVKPEQVHVTPGREYVVHALAVYEGVLFLQIVDDLGYPSWKPMWLFNASGGVLPRDWICSSFPEEEPQLIVGPDFIARDQSAYSRMVELDAEQVDRFWRRLDALKGLPYRHGDGTGTEGR